MDSLGGYFRGEREAQGLTFEQLAASTKIQEFYLEALEEERFNLLPEKVFAKGFVRIYARALGLDEEEALRRFSASAAFYYQSEEEEQKQVIQREEDDRKGKADRNAVFILTGVVLIGLVFIVSREQPSSPKLQTSSTSKSISSTQSAPIVEPKITNTPSEVKTGGGGQASMTPPTPDTKKKSIQVAAVSKVEATPARPVQSVIEPEPIIQKSAVPQSVKSVKPMRVPFKPGLGEQDGPIMLELEALELTWVVVRSDDRAPHEALLQPGERALWRAHERFWLTLGNAGGVKVRLNGEPRGPFGEQGRVIHDLEIKP